VLLLTSGVAAIAVLMPWARGRGMTIPDTSDVAGDAVSHPGAFESVRVLGVTTAPGATILAAICLVTVVALWRTAPSYRPSRAGHLCIAASALAMAAALWFVLDADLRTAALGKSIDLQSDTVTLTAWPWITLGCAVIGCIAGVLLVPRHIDVADRVTTDRSPARSS
jgi:hypothetical protein